MFTSAQFKSPLHKVLSTVAANRLCGGNFTLQITVLHIWCDTSASSYPSLPLSLDPLSPFAVDTSFSTVISSAVPKSSVLFPYSFAFLLSTSFLDTAIDHGCHRLSLGRSATASCFSSEHHHSDNATRCPLPRGFPRKSDLRRRSKHIRYLDLLHHKLRL